MIVFDIETGPLPLDSIRHLMPEFVDYVGEFDPASVKCGNLKDAAKIKEKVDAARAAHQGLQASQPFRKAAHESQFLERAALSPGTGCVRAIGFLEEGKSHLHCDDERTEIDLLIRFWSVFQHTAGPMVGHNIFGFDLPFLVRRSYLLDVDVPTSVRKGRYWSPVFIDTMDVWSCGAARDYIKLDDLAKVCGLDGKLEGVNGANFSGLLETDPEKAKEYLKRDLEVTWNVAVKLQIC